MIHPSAFPPPLCEHHVRVPDELAQILGAKSLHREGITGRGVRVAVVDSGFYPHPYYSRENYQIHWIATDRDPEPDSDIYGHGTAQLACLLAIAPEAQVFAIKCLDVDPSQAIKRALDLRIDILSCAWGFDIDRPSPARRRLPSDFKALHELLQSAVGSGVCVVAAAGNGQYSFPGSMREVISAGGVYYGEDREFHPSDISSSYESSFFPKRLVPDLCGLAGNLPHGRLLLLPVPPHAKLAKRPGFRPKFSSAEEKKQAFGWALFSGTSAATAMISGAAALLKQEDPTITPERIRQKLVQSAREVYKREVYRREVSPGENPPGPTSQERVGHTLVLDLENYLAQRSPVEPPAENLDELPAYDVSLTNDDRRDGLA